MRKNRHAHARSVHISVVSPQASTLQALDPTYCTVHTLGTLDDRVR